MSYLLGAVHLACEYGMEYVVETLLNYCEPWDLSRINTKQSAYANTHHTSHADPSTVTPLHVAASAGHVRPLQLLCEAGCKPSAPFGPDKLQAIHLAVRTPNVCLSHSRCTSGGQGPH